METPGYSSLVVVGSNLGRHHGGGSLEEEDLEKSMEWVEKRGKGNTMNSE